MQRKITVFPTEGSKWINLRLRQYRDIARLEVVGNDGQIVRGGLIGIINIDGKLVLEPKIHPDTGLSLDTQGYISVFLQNRTVSMQQS